MTAMFLTCPHCGFLAALILPPAAAEAIAPRCPRCGGSLRVDPVNPVRPVQGDTPADAHAADVDAAAAAAVDTDTDTDVDADADADADASVSARTTTDTGSTNSRAGLAPVNANSAAAAIMPGNSVADGLADTPGTTVAQHSTAPVARRQRKVRPPSFVRGPAPIAPAAGRQWPRAVAVATLGLLLALQLLLAQRHELAASARWRPWVAGLCHALSCTVPAWREPRAFTMLSRSVQPSRTSAGLLSVEARFRNDARWPQPWPSLVLTLADVEGRPVGTRAFAPAEYRASSQREGAVHPGELLAPGETGIARMLVREPMAGIVAFTFDFQ